MKPDTAVSSIQYERFELLINSQPSESDYRLTVLESPAGEAKAVCHLDSTDPELQDALDALYAGSIDAPFVQDIGAYLFETLFVGDVAAALRTSLGIVRMAGKGLRIQLRIEAPDLEPIPWEYLYDPQEDANLALTGQVTLVRYVPLRLPVRPTKCKLPLRILHVIAAPADAVPLDVDREQRILTSAMEQLIDQGRVELSSIKHATVARINEAIRRIRPHVFHFSGHGMFTGDDAAVLLENEHGQGHLVDARRFREFFSASRETRLAVLNACETATRSTATPLAGMAPRLLQRQLSAVVAMQAPITDEAALIFTREFYRSLALGYPIDGATAEARRGLYMELGADDSSWGIPVLFLRARSGRLFELEEAASDRSTLPPPVRSVPLPTNEGFVGRAVELSYFSDQLRSYGSAVISGMTGVGKTALAVALARKWPAREKVFWHTFHPGDEVGSMLWPLAGFLYWNQQPELWNMLQSAQMAGGQPPPLPVMIDYVIQMLRGREYLVCLDNIHWLNDDPLLRTLVERLRPRLAAGEIAFIATSQRVPDFFRKVDQLEGLSEADTAALVAANDIELAADLTEALHAHTHGNVEFLLIACDALRNAPDPVGLIRRLAKVGDMRTYLLKRLDEFLTDEERHIESAVAVLGIPSPRDAIEVVLDADNLRRTLHSLAERYLLTVSQEDWVRAYGQHAILQDFYYDYLSRRLRLEFHRRAAEYFEFDARHPVQAAHHYHQAHENLRAVDIAVEHVQWAINHYQAHALMRVLNSLANARLPHSEQGSVELALGRLHAFLGARVEAKQHYRDALAAPATSEIDHERRLDSFLGLGQLSYNEDPHSAIAWFHKALDELPACAEARRNEWAAAIQLDLGWALLRLHRLAEAEHALERTLELLGPEPSRQRVEALLRLAHRHLMVFDLEKAMQIAEAAAAESRIVADVWLSQTVRAELAGIKHVACEWNDAIAIYEDALASAIGLGDVLTQTALHIRIGTAQHNLGNTEPARHHLRTGIRLAQRNEFALFELKAQLQLGRLETQLKAWNDAETHLDAAASLVEALGTPDALAHLPLVQVGQAQLELAMGRPVEALQTARQAVAEAVAQEKQIDLAVCLRVEAEALMAQARFDEAASLLEEALGHLAGRNPYEIAKTQALLGRALSVDSDGDMDRLALGRRLMADATIAFTRLGAKLDLAALAMQ